MSSRARRPYLMGKKSVTEFYQAPVRFLKNIVGKESEFEKPYEEEEYRKMHFDFPWPDWPPLPEIPPWPPWSPPEGPVPGLPGCAIVCYPPGGGDCDSPIWCHPGIWCGADLGCTLCSWTVVGATSGYSWKKLIDGVPSKIRGIEIWIDENLLVEGKALIHAQMKDPCGNLCGKDVEVTCKVCPPDIIMTWDSDLSASEITRDATVDIYVKDGLGPYSWSVIGTGFTLGHVTTDGIHNTLIADNTACGTAKITVTDFCDDSVNGHVLCTEGEWEPVCDSINTSDCYHHDIPAPDTYHYFEDKKITIEQRCLYSWTGFCRFGACGGFNSSNYRPSWPCYTYPKTSCVDIIGSGYICSPEVTAECCSLNLGIRVHKWSCSP